MTILQRCSSLAPYGFFLATVAILSAILVLTTTAEDTHAQSSVPSVPTGLTATSVSQDSVTLNWDDPGDASVTGYLVLRRDAVNQEPGTFTTLEPNTGSSATTYTDDTVEPETLYVYRVKAINPDGTSEQSNYVNVETPAAPTPAVPAQPAGLTATSVSHDSVTLSWYDPGDDTITGYQVLRRSRDGEEYGDGEGTPEFATVVEDTGSSATTYTDTSVTAHTRYVYRVKAINSEGMSQRSTYLNVETPEEPTPEPAPTNAPATGTPTITGTAQVGETLTSDTSGIADADGLANVSFSHQWTADDTEIQGATHHSYTLVDAEEGKVIKVRVSFTDDRGNDEALTSEATSAVEPREVPGVPPYPPTNLTAVANSDGSVTLTWDAPDDDSITGYQVLRRHPGETENTMVETVVNTEDTATTFTDSDLTLGVLHAYSVKAISTAGPSGRSNYDNATPHTDSTPITVYLTFDDGPEPPYTNQILDLLQRYGARATFFVTGSNAALHPGLLARMASERHSIGNHTWQHESLSSLSSDEFTSTVMRTQEQIGPHASACLRPPNGDRGGFVDVWASRLGLEIVMWHHSPGDAEGPGVEAIVERLYSEMWHGRSTVLLHDSGGEGQTVEALGILLERWSRIGYQFKPICESPDVAFSPENQPPEGPPTISGEPRVGNVLTSHTSAVADGDGMDNASFSYKWLSDNVEIAGANSSDFLIPAKHDGKTITVRVSFTDGEGNRESLTSKPTAPVAEAEPPTGSPGAPRNLTLSANTGVVGEVVVSWSAPDNTGGSGITGYQLERKPSWGYWGNPWDVTTIQLPGRSKKITGLDRRWQHDVRVRAINQSGEGAASEERATPFGTSPLVATFQNVPENHNGTDPFELTIAFTRDIVLGIIAFRDGALDVVGGMVLRVEASENRSDLFKVVILPKGGTHVTVSLPSSRDCHAWGAFCTSDGQVLSSRSHVTVPLGDNAPASGSPAITGTVQVGEALTADTSSISDADGMNGATFAYQWIRGDGTADTEIPGATGSSYTLVSDDDGKTIKVRVSFTDDRGNGEALTSAATAAVAPSDQQEQTQEPTCGDGYVPPTPTDVAVTVVPVVVGSTADDYFVLYVSHDVDGATVWYPVLVKRGESGTTTLSESVASLPVERYRVERYRIANPGDVDGDCIDDLTELDNLGPMSPVNPAGTLSSSLGKLAVPDHQTFRALAYPLHDRRHMKFVVLGIDEAQPRIYFANTPEYQYHPALLWAIDDEVDFNTMRKGTITYDADLVAPDGAEGVYLVEETDFEDIGRIYTLLAAAMPFVDNKLVVWVRNRTLVNLRYPLPLAPEAVRMNLMFDEDFYDNTGFQALNPGEGYGLLRSLDPGERPHSRDVVIYETLPNELPRVAGVISTVAQTPLSHVNLRALQDNVPNAYIAGALENDDISSLIDGYVYYAVSEDGYTIRAATQAEVDGHHDASRPARTQTPERDLAIKGITDLDDIGFDDWDSFGVKAANLAVLRTLGFPGGTVPDGFAIPFYFYDEFMKHNGLYDDVREMLADPGFQSSYDTKASRLKELRKSIKDAETPEWIIDALTAMHATYPEGQSLRYRSSTNNEDLPDFNGAGLYDSKTQKPGETEEEGIDKSLKQVYASLWNFRAFIERDFHRIDHLATAMGVLVHPNYQDELVNGVAVSADPAYGTPDGYYVNAQVGEDLVTNPEARSAPEEMLLYPEGRYDLMRLSNQNSPGQMLMTRDQLRQLRWRLERAHERFAELYGIEDGEEFAVEIEFKITSENTLAIKQARPWIFAGPAPEVETVLEEEPDSPLTARIVEAPGTHDGSPFTLRFEFSDFVAQRYNEPKYAVTVTGGTVTNAWFPRGKELAIYVVPKSASSDVHLVMLDDRPCSVRAAICTYNGRRLANRLEHTVHSLPPGPVDRPTGRALSPDSVALEWNEVPSASSYEVQFRHSGRWTDLPVNGTDIEFDGAAAVVRGLPDSHYHFRVRAVNSNGRSTWSDQLFLPLRTAWEGELVTTRTAGVFPTMSGYSAHGTVDGTLSPNTFELEGTTYEVRYVVHASESLWLNIDQELPGDFIFFVGNSTYRGSESTVPSSWDGVGYWWPSTHPWPADATVRVGLVVSPDEALGARRKAPVTGYFRSFPSEHDGREAFSFRVHFSEDVAATAEALRSHVLSVSGGTVSGVEPVRGEGKIWAVSFTPDSLDPVTVEIEAGLDCALPGAVCTTDGRSLFNRMVLTVGSVERHPATGVPTISGTLEVGHTLTADTSGIADGDGMTGATFSYQWVSHDGAVETDIQVATGSTYTLVPADEGKAFRVRVSFIDDAGFRQSLTSALARWERPYGLSASESDGVVVLTWNLPAGWSASSMFQILRNRPELGEDEPLVHVRFLHTEANVYTDTDVEPGVMYVYRVKGVDPFGYTGEASRPVEIRTATPDALQGEPSRPNIVLILADDFGWGDVETNNPDSAMTTPRIDSISISGANFTDAHSPSSMCSPTRYGLLTGRYAWRSWLTEGVLGGSSRPLIGPSQPTLGTLLQGHGYRTAAVGKWHLGMEFTLLSDIHAVNDLNGGIDFAARIMDGPLDHGFHEFFGTTANLAWKPKIYIRNRHFLATPDSDNQPSSAFYRIQDVLDRLTQEAVSFVERSADSGDPFFLYLPLHAVHVPLSPNAQFAGHTGLGRYADVVAQMDWSVGQVLDALDQAGVRDNTLVIFSSDNGASVGGIPLPNHIGENHMSNGHWRGGKGHISEGGHRVPLLMQWPSRIHPGSSLDVTVSLTDLYATLADIVGDEPQPGVAPDSVSLLPLLLGETQTRGTPIVHHSKDGMFALRDGRWKLVFGNGYGGDHGSNPGVPFGTPWRLFDLEQDPGERTSVAEDNPEIMTRMESTLERIRAAEDGALSSDATLKSLQLAGVDTGPFYPDIRTYAAFVENGIESVEVTAYPTETDARMRISTTDGSLLYGKPLRGRVEVGLAEPVTTIAISVTSPDKSAITRYMVTAGATPRITGVPQVSRTLTADTTRMSKAYGLTNPTFTYQWAQREETKDANIAGATDETYTLTTQDQGKSILVRVSFTDDQGNSHTLTSPATTAVDHATSELTAAQGHDTFPVISGYSDYGDLGTLSPNGWQIDGAHYTVKFLFHSSGGLMLGMERQLPTDFTLHVGGTAYRASESKLPTGEAEARYWWPLSTPDWTVDEPVQIKLAIHSGVPLGERPRALITGYFRNHPPDHDGSKAFSFRLHFSDDVDTTAEAMRDHVLSVSGGTLSGVHIARGDGKVWDISVTPDSRDTITVGIEAGIDCTLPAAVCTEDGRQLFNSMQLVVPMRPNSPARGRPTITGVAETGETLTSDISGIADANGLTGATFKYQWTAYDGATYSDIQEATDPTYTLTPEDEGKAFRLRVSFTDDLGYEESLTSNLARSERPYGLNATESDGTVVLTWNLPAAWSYGTTFQILRHRPELGESEPLIHVRYFQGGGNTCTDTDVEPGTFYVYRVKGVDPFGYTGEASRPVEIRTAGP